MVDALQPTQLFSKMQNKIRSVYEIYYKPNGIILHNIVSGREPPIMDIDGQVTSGGNEFYEATFLTQVNAFTVLFKDIESVEEEMLKALERHEKDFLDE